MELNPECQDIKANNNQVIDNDNTIDCLLDKFTEKYLQIELIKELVNKGETNLEKRKQDLKDKINKLNDLHNRIFEMEHNFCESIWKFTAEHNFASVINQILDDKSINHNLDDQVLSNKISSAKNDVQTMICDIDDVLINIDKALISLNKDMTAEIEKERKKIFEDNPLNFVEKIKNEPAKNLISIKKESDFKIPVKLETPERPTIKLLSNFSVKKKSSICKKFEMSNS